MKYYTIVLFASIFCCRFLYAQQKIAINPQKIVIEAEFPDKFYKGSSSKEVDSLGLQFVPTSYVDIYPNYKMLRGSQIQNGVKWILYSDKPLMIVAQTLGRLPRFVQPGDSINIKYLGGVKKYSGPGSMSLKLQDDLRAFLDSMLVNKRPTNVYVDIKSISDYFKWKEYFNIETDSVSRIINFYRQQIPEDALNLVRVNTFKGIERQRLESFLGLFYLTDLSASSQGTKVLNSVYDSTLNHKVFEDFKQSDIYGSDADTYFQYSKISVYKEFGFDRSRHEIDTKEERTARYINYIKHNYKGLLQERLLQYAIAIEVIKELGYNSALTSTLLKNYYRESDFPEYKAWMIEYEKLAAKKYNFGNEPTKKINTTLAKAIAKDGPYIFYIGDTIQLKYVEKVRSLRRVHSTSRLNRSQISFPVNTDQYPKTFEVQLKSSLEIEKDSYSEPSKQLIVSDIEGNFDALRRLLQSNKVIDKNYNWIFGDGHLVCIGDFFDRGEQVTEVLWLIYSLEEKSKKSGGYVHFILGNHEILNLSNDTRYVSEKYNINAKAMGVDYKLLYDENTEIGRWLRTKNIIEKIGSIVVTHGGFAKEVNNLNYSLNQLNSAVRPHLSNRDELKTNKTNSELMTLFNSTTSPFWYRGYYDKNEKTAATLAQIDSTLDKFNAVHIVTGHTIVADTVSMHYGGRIFNTDTRHSEGKSEALLIEGNNFYRINDRGERRLLFNGTADKKKTQIKNN